MFSPSMSLHRCLAIVALSLAAMLVLPHRVAADLFGMHSLELQDGFAGEIAGTPNSQDHLGRRLAAGDFDGDGRDDLAISDREAPAHDELGAVHILYSDPSGAIADQKLFDFDPATGLPDRESGDDFGSALAAGNFNGDPWDDLAIGIAGENIGAVADAGMVLVLYGSPTGLGGAGAPAAKRWRLGADGIVSTPVANDGLGGSLASGDFDNDGRDDLAIGMPFASVAGQIGAGKVLVMYGSDSGLDAPDNRIFAQNSVDADGTMQGDAEVGDSFGFALAVGDFNQDAHDDLAIGVPGEPVGGFDGAGAVQIVYGFAGPGTRGLRLTNNQAWTEANVETGGDVAAGDGFGFALAVGALTADGADDLAIGAPREDVAGSFDAGAVTVLRGDPAFGLSPLFSELYDQSDLGDGESIGSLDLFGWSLAVGQFVSDISGGGPLDLAIGIPLENVAGPGGEVIGAGAVTVVPGGPLVLDPADAILWAQGLRGSAGAATLDENQAYGHTLAAGDFDGNGDSDLAIGAIYVPGQISPGSESSQAGAVYVIYGALFADGFETADSDLWSTTTP